MLPATACHQQEREEVLTRQLTLLHEVCAFENDQGDCPKNEQDDEAREGARHNAPRMASRLISKHGSRISDAPAIRWRNS